MKHSWGDGGEHDPKEVHIIPWEILTEIPIVYCQNQPPRLPYSFLLHLKRRRNPALYVDVEEVRDPLEP